jgi:hypothetical protein
MHKDQSVILECEPHDQTETLTCREHLVHAVILEGCNSITIWYWWLFHRSQGIHTLRVLYSITRLMSCRIRVYSHQHTCPRHQHTCPRMSYTVVRWRRHNSANLSGILRPDSTFRALIQYVLRTREHTIKLEAVAIAGGLIVYTTQWETCSSQFIA